MSSNLNSALTPTSARVPPVPSARATRESLLALAREFEIDVRGDERKELLKAIIADEAEGRLALALEAAHEAGMEAAARVSPGIACGRGAVLRRGSVPHVGRPLLESPFGQDYDRHVAYVRVAASALLRHGVDACEWTELD